MRRSVSVAANSASSLQRPLSRMALGFNAFMGFAFGAPTEDARPFILNRRTAVQRYIDPVESFVICSPTLERH
jgi:hypothetical protein